MAQRDWLLRSDRGAEAVDRIYDAASTLVSQRGFDAFTIDALAAKVHCSPATIYRHAGGKAVILEGVMNRLSARIVQQVVEKIDGTTGAERVSSAVVVALGLIRSEPLGQLMMGSVRPDADTGWLTSSPLVADLAETVMGRSDPLGAQWLIRLTLALWFWPVKDRATEAELIRRFVGPSFAVLDERDGT